MGGTLSVTEEKKEKKKKDWSWSILVVGRQLQIQFVLNKYNCKRNNVLHIKGGVQKGETITSQRCWWKR